MSQGNGGVNTSAATQVEVETLRAFRDRVNGLLKSLDAGAGSSQSISEQVIDPGHPGAGFEEVNALVARYQETHTKLVQLSQTLSQTIDAMTISIDVARLGYENVDRDQIARLWTLHNQEADAAGQTSAASQTTSAAYPSGSNSAGGRTGGL